MLNLMYDDGIIYCDGHAIGVLNTVFTDPMVADATQKFVAILKDIQASYEANQSAVLDPLAALPLEDKIELFLLEHTKAGFVPALELRNFLLEIAAQGEEE